MKPAIRILILEDEPADVALINHELQNGGLAFQSHRVDTEKDFLDELSQHPPDLILSDHGLPSFDGSMALARAFERCPDTPFIFVTGSMTEELAIDAMRVGAPDIVLKTKLSNLVPAVVRALRLADERARRKQAEREARSAQERFTLLAGAVSDQAIILLDQDGLISSWNAGAEKLLGNRAEEMIGRYFGCCYRSEDRDLGKPERELSVAAEEGRLEETAWRVRQGRGAVIVRIVITALRNAAGDIGGLAHLLTDVSERHATAERLRRGEAMLHALIDADDDQAVWLLDSLGCVVTWNAGAKQRAGYREPTIVGCGFDLFYSSDEVARRVPAQVLAAAANHGSARSEGWRLREDGSRFWARVVLTALRDMQGGLAEFVCVTRDLTKQRANDAEIIRLKSEAAGRTRPTAFTPRDSLPPPGPATEPPAPSRPNGNHPRLQVIAHPADNVRSSGRNLAQSADHAPPAAEPANGRESGFSLPAGQPDLPLRFPRTETAPAHARSAIGRRAPASPAPTECAPGAENRPAPVERAVPVRAGFSPLQRAQQRAVRTTAEAERSLTSIISQTRTPWGGAALLSTTQVEEIEKVVRSLKSRLSEREVVLTEIEARLADKERGLAEAEALLTAREQVVAAMKRPAPGESGAKIPAPSATEVAAIDKLQEELERQEQSLKEAQANLKAREEFIEHSETALLQKIQAHEDRELELEQREEDFLARTQRFGLEATLSVA